MRRLLIRPGAIGDCVLWLPVLDHLRADYTEVWVPSACMPLIQHADRVRSIASTGLDLLGVGDLPAPERLVETLRSFDSVISWYGGNRPEFCDAIRAFGIPFHFHAALPPADCKTHATDFFACQVGAQFSLIPHIETAISSARNTIVIHPFSGSRRKNWPIDQYCQMARRLPLPVEWSSGPEEELPQAIRFENLLELAHWIRGARLYIGNDSGITHLAAAAGAPVLALFGSTDPSVWAPRGPNVTVMRSEPIHAIAAYDILAAVQRLLE